MVRPERRVDLAGESPVRESAAALGSRLQPGGEIRLSRAECQKPLKTRGANQRAATKVNAIATSYLQPKGVREGRAGHVAAKATDSIAVRRECWTSPGSQAVARWDGSTTEQERPSPAAKSGKDWTYKAGKSKADGAGRESEGFVVCAEQRVAQEG
jgi:hypothetical protein